MLCDVVNEIIGVSMKSPRKPISSPPERANVLGQDRQGRELIVAAH